jgi:Reverse transcriptase (RNA-dependent DNA polymerase)
MLQLIQMWLKVPVEERDEKGKKRLMGGRDNDRGTPQGGVISPLLANLYMNRMLKGWKQTKRGEQFQARVVAYADDFVILSRGKANEALGWARGVLTRLGLTLNEAKTSIRNARQERFDFLGYTRYVRKRIRPALQQADRAGVHRLQSVEEECESDQRESGRAFKARQCGRLGRSARPAESETERLESVLRPGESIQGIRSAR